MSKRISKMLFSTEKVELNISNLEIKLKNVCVYNVVPPVQKHNTHENLEYPYLGTDEERKKYVLYFNKKLKQKCIEKNYVFFDVYDFYKDNKHSARVYYHSTDKIEFDNFQLFLTI